jgi:fructokinase
MLWGCSQCDILKISEDEAEFVTGEKTEREAAAAIRKMFPEIKLIFVTSGKKGR